MSKIIPLRRVAKIGCSSCGATIDAVCDCGAPYVPAGQRAAEAIAANPRMSDRALAQEAGVDRETIARARKSTGGMPPVEGETRIGRDGKSRRAVPETSRESDVNHRIAFVQNERARERPSPQRGREATCDRVREALTILSGLPPAHEVVGYFAGTDAAIIISERLRPAAAWLADFSDAWKDEQC